MNVEVFDCRAGTNPTSSCSCGSSTSHQVLVNSDAGAQVSVLLYFNSQEFQTLIKGFTHTQIEQIKYAFTMQVTKLIEIVHHSYSEKLLISGLDLSSLQGVDISAI